MHLSIINLLNFNFMSGFKFPKSFLGVVNRPPRTGHDMSRREAYSLPFGTICPVSFDFAQPNEHYKGSVSSYVQTNAMREDNFTAIYNHMKAVFVPMSSLKRNFLQFTPLTDSTRLRRDLSVPQIYNRPILNVTGFLRVVFPYYFVNYLLTNALSIDSNLLDYKVTYSGNNLYAVEDQNGDAVTLTTSTNPFAIVLLYGFKDQSVTKWPLFRAYYNSLSKLISRSNQFFVFDVLRLFDSLGYGNYWPVLSDLCSTLEHQLITGADAGLIDPNDLSFLMSVTVTGDPDNNMLEFVINVENLGSYVTRYCPMLSVSQASNESLTPLVAYQYYVAMCEKSSFRYPDTFVFTLDLLSSKTFTGADSFSLGNNIYNIKPSFYDPLVNSTSLIDLLEKSRDLGSHINYCNYWSVILYLLSLSNPLLRSDLVTSSQLSTVSGGSPSAVDVTIDNLNSVSAAYKVRQNLLRAGVRASQYMKAFFGISGESDITQPVLMLDDTRNSITITGLINQAASTVADLGDRAAKGNGQAGLQFSFDTNDYGFIFYIQYMTCDVFYENFRLDRVVSMTPQTVPLPQYANLGLSPIYGDDINSYSRDSNGKWSLNGLSTVGFSSRDWHLKTKLDLVHGLFTNTPLIYTSSNYSNLNSIKSLPSLSRGNAVRGGFVVSLYDQQKDNFAGSNDLYFRPGMLNGIMNQMNDGILFANSVFDPFSIITSFNIYKVSPMADLGLPKLI